MTVATQVSVYSQVLVPRDYGVFGGLDVDRHSIAATFTDHWRLMQSLRLPYSTPQLLNDVRKHFHGSDWRLFTKRGRRGSVSTMSWWRPAMFV